MPLLSPDDLAVHLDELILGEVVSATARVIAAVKARQMEQWMRTVQLGLEHGAAVRSKTADEHSLPKQAAERLVE